MPAGPNASFQQWSNYNQHNFDLAVLQWTEDELLNTEDLTYFEEGPAQKWHLIGAFANKFDLSGYEYIWCLDDDCITTPENIAQTFDFCKQHNLDLAQPGLAPGSYNSHAPTLQIQDSIMHITDTVEIMCPIFSQKAWSACNDCNLDLPWGIGYGLEGYWQGVLECSAGITKFGGRVAVIDQLPVQHIKPVTQAHEYAAMGMDPNDDGMYFANKGFGNWTFRTLEVIKNTLRTRY